MGENALAPTALRDPQGRRKYLSRAEREAFFVSTDSLQPVPGAFCRMLFFTGCRISEALALTGLSLDQSEQSITVETLKQRKRGVYRTLPLPEAFVREVAAIAERNRAECRLFPFCRQTGRRIVVRAMREAGIEGPQATPKGLRHGFGIACAQANIPMNLIQRWMGHRSAQNTAIYLDALGEEERAFAARLW